MSTFEVSLVPKLIYIFTIPDKTHKGCIKIGETQLTEDFNNFPAPNSTILNSAACKRIDSYTRTAGIAYQLLYTEMASSFRGKVVYSFNDKEIHHILERSGIKKKEFDNVHGADEWFVCDLETAKLAITAAKKGRSSLQSHEISKERTPIIFRPEQSEAIKKTTRQFARGNQMLWNAKMRFGKTLCALQVVKEMEFSKTIIITHRPVVDQGWFDDFNKIFYDRKDFHYGSHKHGENDFFSKHSKWLTKNQHIIYFVSLQDMRGSDIVGGKFDKNSEVFSTDWDCIIIDEAHEGTQTELGKAVIDTLTKDHTKVLQLSGTPFNLMDKFNEKDTYTWDYVMEQQAKRDWDEYHKGDHNPYSGLPEMNIYTYDLGKLIKAYADLDVAFNFREFFRTREDLSFIHENDVKHFLNLLCKDDPNSLYPYANEKFRNIFRHTLWVLPGVRSAKAMSLLLRQHPIFGKYEIVNVAGDGDDDELKAEPLDLVEKAIGKNPLETFTITLTCGRLTTGVTIKPWTAVFMLSGSVSTAASSYMQTIFRVQSSFECNGKIKTKCYAFDFAPDRTLKILAETAKISAKAGETTDDDRKILGDFLNFCPIISIEGSQMKPHNVNSMMKQLKRAQIEHVVQNGFEDGQLYNNELLRLSDMDIAAFNGLQKIIGKTKAMSKTPEVEINKQGFSDEEHEQVEKTKKKKVKERTPEEQALLEKHKQQLEQRRKAIAILRGISIRMPLLIYGANINDENEEITIDNFTSIIDDPSWVEFMPNGVTKPKFEEFKKYYEPDIFREAGKRIRAMALAADNLTVEERIMRIATIFNTFRNPDKETVLTPWRVVNMHMSDCLGGYCFYDETFKKELEKPRYVYRGDVTDQTFNIDTRVLEINSKSGLYPLYIAYNIYRCKLEEMKQRYGDVEVAFSKRIWDDVIENNIFVICKTEMAKTITQRTLIGFRKTKVNTETYNDLINTIRTNPNRFVNIVNDPRFWGLNIKDKSMNFTAIVGNPPYQEMDGGAGVSAKPVYNLFVNVAKQMRPQYISMIMPAKWYNNGKGLDAFRQSMLSDKHLSVLVDYEDSDDCFTGVDIAGGVCYFMWAKSYHGNCKFTSHRNGNTETVVRKLSEHDTFVRYTAAIEIITKIKKKTNNFMNTIVSRQKPFGLRTFARPLEDGDITLRYTGGKGPYKRELITVKKEWIDKWKVITSYLTYDHAGRANSDGQKRIISTLEILKPEEICTETYLVLGVYETEQEALSAMAYTKTKFVRFLIGLLASTQHLSKDVFAFVPMQDFTKDSDIDWSAELPEIDKQLYRKYGLSKKEVEFIEKMIKSMS